MEQYLIGINKNNHIPLACCELPHGGFKLSPRGGFTENTAVLLCQTQSQRREVTQGFFLNNYSTVAISARSFVLYNVVRNLIDYK